MRAAVLGAGNWGTTLAHLAARSGHDVTLWTRAESIRDEVNGKHTNAPAVPGLVLDDKLRATCDLAEAVRGASVVLIVIPAQAMREVCRGLGDSLAPDQMVLHASKGLELGTRARMSEIIAQETCARQIGVVSGPNIAHEIADGKPAGTVVVSRFPRVVEAGRALLSSPRLMVFGGSDVVGTELAGALKNIVAIAGGMADAMDVGDNAKALLLSRGLAEMTRLATALGGEHATFTGLVGIGDLIATCASPHSRNHRVGVALAKGETLDAALARLGMVAEGVPTSRVGRELARELGLDSPLFDRVYRVVHEGLAPAEALEQLMRLPAGRDGLPGLRS